MITAAFRPLGSHDEPLALGILRKGRITVRAEDSLLAKQLWTFLLTPCSTERSTSLTESDPRFLPGSAEQFLLRCEAVGRLGLWAEVHVSASGGQRTSSESM